MNTTTSSNGKVTARVVTVTPKIAAEWLTKSVRGRPISEVDVATYAEDMEHGRWTFNGNTIVFCEDGRLLDGKRRLCAVIRAFVPVDFLVVEGVDEKAILTIDSGLRRRAPVPAEADAPENVPPRTRAPKTRSTRTAAR